MADTSTCDWNGHQFTVYDPDISWNDVGGIYIFAKQNPADKLRWFAQYIGKTKSFKTRMSDHEEWDAAVLLGATHIHARVVQETTRRKQLEIELIRKFQPPLNDQHK